MRWKNTALLGAALSAAALISAPARADQFIDQANACMHGFGESAIEACTWLIQSGQLTGDNLAGAFANRGAKYDGLGQYARAIQDYDQAIKLKPDFIPVLNSRGIAYAKLGQHSRAIENYDEIIKLMPNFVGSYANRGISYRGLGQYARAIEDYDYALKLKPDDPIVLNDRCEARASWGQQLDIALSDCNEAVRLAPAQPAFLDTRGFVYFRMGNYAGAIADYSAALAINPKMPTSLYVRGLAKLKTGDATGGNADIAAAKTIDPNIADTYKDSGVTLIGDGAKP